MEIGSDWSIPTCNKYHLAFAKSEDIRLTKMAFYLNFKYKY